MFLSTTILLGNDEVIFRSQKLVSLLISLNITGGVRIKFLLRT